VEIQASVPGQGDGNTTVQFRPLLYKERVGLLLLNGVVYTGWSSHCDDGNYHGWIIGYDASKLQQAGVYTDTPNWDAGSFWQGGAAPAADANGNIYVVSANGTFDVNTGGSDLGESIIKLSTSKNLFAADYFTPFNAHALSEQDLDLGSSGALLLPDAAGSLTHPHLLVSGSKSGTVYLLDRDNLGHFRSGANDQIVQSLIGSVGPVFGIPVYFNNTLYFSGEHDQVKAFSVQNGLLSVLPSSASIATYGGPGTVPSISANGTANGILWTIDSAAQLHAYNAADLSHQLYQGNVGSYVKFSTPTIANGKVYVGTLNSLVVFGLQNAASGSVVSVVNAAGGQPGPVAPGSVVSIFGPNLAPATRLVSHTPWPQLLGQTSVFINGFAAPLGYVSPNQINAQVPFETQVGQATVTVVAGGHVLLPKEITVQATALGLFVDPQRHVVAQNQDGTLNGTFHPAGPETLLTVYLTGQGALSTPLSDGAAAPAGTPIIPQAFVTATIGGQSVAVLGVRMSATLVGVLDVTLVTPSLGPGEEPLMVGMNGALSNAGLVTLGVN
jgi:uncharacterized protein (TIGR03437 family)